MGHALGMYLTNISIGVLLAMSPFYFLRIVFWPLAHTDHKTALTPVWCYCYNLCKMVCLALLPIALILIVIGYSTWKQVG